MKLDKKKNNVCQKDREMYKKIYNSTIKKYIYQYTYKTQEGMLFSCVGLTLEDCRERKSSWIEGLKCRELT